MCWCFFRPCGSAFVGHQRTLPFSPRRGGFTRPPSRANPKDTQIRHYAELQKRQLCNSHKGGNPVILSFFTLHRRDVACNVSTNSMILIPAYFGAALFHFFQPSFYFERLLRRRKRDGDSVSFPMTSINKYLENYFLSLRIH